MMSPTDNLTIFPEDSTDVFTAGVGLGDGARANVTGEAVGATVGAGVGLGVAPPIVEVVAAFGAGVGAVKCTVVLP